MTAGDLSFENLVHDAMHYNYVFKWSLLGKNLLLVFVFVMFCMQFICIDFSYKSCILLLKNTLKTKSKMHGLQLKMHD